jgi:arsenate reductase-like glutaredoxin family protein
LDAQGIEPKETIPASRKLSSKDAAALAKAASKVVVMKGKKVDEFKPGGKAPKALVEAMLGPTGNLRAPTIRTGKTVLVGFNEDVFGELLG